MDMKTYLKSTTPEERLQLASKVGCTPEYFFHISGGHRKPSTSLAKRLVAADPRLSLAGLRPDIWA